MVLSTLPTGIISSIYIMLFILTGIYTIIKFYKITVNEPITIKDMIKNSPCIDLSNMVSPDEVTVTVLPPSKNNLIIFTIPRAISKEEARIVQCDLGYSYRKYMFCGFNPSPEETKWCCFEKNIIPDIAKIPEWCPDGDY